MPVLLVVLTFVATSPSWAADPQAGLQLAREACAFCHVVEDGGRGSDAVPSFRAIAREAGDNIASLRSFTVAPHPQMPQFADLSERQLDDLIAYFRSLQN
ncbi:MAG TPA: cytochrome c [Kiloniellales bacterium]|nr:cytochrome c [Kiloniellales bacterium]